MFEEFLNGRVIVKVGDITAENVDAVVNAANSSLLGGGGVDGAIHSKGGSEVLRACRLIRQDQFPDGLPTGEAVITTAGNLPAKYVIHTVGPVYGENGGRDADLLAAAYENSLRLAAENGLSSIAFPSISTGVYGYPKDEAAQVVSMTLRRYVQIADTPTNISLIFFSEADARVFLQHSTL